MSDELATADVIFMQIFARFAKRFRVHRHYPSCDDPVSPDCVSKAAHLYAAAGSSHTSGPPLTGGDRQVPTVRCRTAHNASEAMQFHFSLYFASIDGQPDEPRRLKLIAACRRRRSQRFLRYLMPWFSILFCSVSLASAIWLSSGWIGLIAHWQAPSKLTVLAKIATQRMQALLAEAVICR